MNKIVCFFIAVIFCYCGPKEAAAQARKAESFADIKKITADAVAAWHFDERLQQGKYLLHRNGAVQVGVKLRGTPYDASVKRGGDGKVAVFEGGYLQVDGPALNPPGAVFTLAMRIKDEEGAWNMPLFGSYGGDSRASIFLRGVDGPTMPKTNRDYNSGQVLTPAAWMFGWPNGPREIRGSRGVLEFTWGATALAISPARAEMLPRNVPAGEFVPLLHDVKNSVQRIMFPMEAAGPRDWHDIIIRATGAKLQLWIDGVLLDEEFPIGNTRAAQAGTYFGAAIMSNGRLLSGFKGMIDHAFFWHRALSDDEVTALSGGAAVVKKRQVDLLGPVPSAMQYYRSPGHNLKPGDCIPYFDEEKKIFHLFYLVLRRNMNSKWDGGHGALEVHHASSKNLREWTQHPVAHPISEQWEAWNGTGAIVFSEGKYWMFFPSPDYEGDKSGIQLLTSTDAIHFTKQTPHPFIKGGDCEIFPDPDAGIKRWHMVKGGATEGDKMMIDHFVSDDLKQWTKLPEPFMVTDKNLHPSTCPNWFRFNDWYYYIGAGNIWKSKQPYGPWTLQSPARVDELAVPKTAAFDGNRRIFAGFVIDGGYGGNLVLRDMVQFEDGTLGTKFIPEMLPQSGNPISLVPVPTENSTGWDGTKLLLQAAAGRELFLLDKLPNDARITLTLVPQEKGGAFGLQLRTTDGLTDGVEFRLDASKKQAGFSKGTTSGGAGGGGAIQGVRGLDGEVRLHIIMTHDILDIEINGQHTLANRFWNPFGDRLGIWVEEGALLIKDITIRPLLEKTPPGAIRSPQPVK